jgi:uncharacterized protein (DUF1015 family)
MTVIRHFPARVVRQDVAPRTVTAMTDSQDDSGVDLYGVAVDPSAYDDLPPSLYVYRQSLGNASYTGVVCDVAVQAIADGRLRGHEAVDQLRVDALIWQHSRTTSAPALVMLVHHAGPRYTRAVAEAQESEPILAFPGPDGFHQTVWRLGEGPDTTALAAELGTAVLYIADGHHRTAAALEEWRLAGKPAEAGLLCVVHPIDGLSLSAFHRRVSGPLDERFLLAMLATELQVREVAGPPVPAHGLIGLYVASRWYEVRLPEVRPNSVADVDARILQSRVLDRIPPLSYGRARTVDAVSAAEPLDELVARCDVDRGALFLLAPPPARALFDVADGGEVMPPKTTYFEPKPAAGIFLRG